MKCFEIIKRIARQVLSVMLLYFILPVGTQANKGLSGSPGDQQGIIITGRVTSGSDNSVMPGVSIVVRDTQRGTVTNSSGEYTIEISGSDAVLIFSFIGYNTQEITVGN